MRAVYLNPFIKSVIQIIENTLYESPEREQPFLRQKYPYVTKDVAIVVGVTGAVQGQVVMSMDRDCAKRIAARMIMEEDIEELDEYAQSALSEMANMITANATMGLADAGYPCDITPPSVIVGEQMEISCQPDIKTIVLPLKLTQGLMDVNLSMKESNMPKDIPPNN